MWVWCLVQVLVSSWNIEHWSNSIKSAYSFSNSSWFHRMSKNHLYFASGIISKEDSRNGITLSWVTALWGPLRRVAIKSEGHVEISTETSRLSWKFAKVRVNLDYVSNVSRDIFIRLDPACWPERWRMPRQRIDVRAAPHFRSSSGSISRTCKETIRRRCGRSHSDAQVSDGITKY